MPPDSAKLSALREHILSGHLASAEDLAWLKTLDILALGALADAQREFFLGRDVWLFEGPLPEAFQSTLILFRPTDENDTGLAWMRALALLRLSTASHLRIAVDIAQVGIELSQIALMFGASVWVNLSPKPIEKMRLPLVSANDTRNDTRAEIKALIHRAGRRPVWMSDVKTQAGALVP